MQIIFYKTYNLQQEINDEICNVNHKYVLLRCLAAKHTKQLMQIFFSFMIKI